MLQGGNKSLQKVNTLLCPQQLVTDKDGLLSAPPSEFSAASFLAFGNPRVSATNPVLRACLSQWYPAPFVTESRTFATAEHYMMHAKALLFGDRLVARLILESTNPVEALYLGRDVRGFDEQRWAANREAIVFDGNLLKFSRNPSLRAHLLSTGSQVLVDANPEDLLWGAGLRETDPALADPARWPGANRLGFILMAVREALAKGCSPYGSSWGNTHTSVEKHG